MKKKLSLQSLVTGLIGLAFRTVVASTCSGANNSGSCDLQMQMCVFGAKTIPHVLLGSSEPTPLSGGQALFGIISPPGTTWDSTNLGGLQDICVGNPEATGMSRNSLMFWAISAQILGENGEFLFSVRAGDALTDEQISQNGQFMTWLRRECASSSGPCSGDLGTISRPLDCSQSGCTMNAYESASAAWNSWPRAQIYMNSLVGCKALLINPADPLQGFQHASEGLSCSMPVCQRWGGQLNAHEAQIVDFDCEESGKELTKLLCTIKRGASGVLGLDCGSSPHWSNCRCAISNRLPNATPTILQKQTPQPGTCISWPLTASETAGMQPYLHEGDKIGLCGCTGQSCTPDPGDGSPNCFPVCYDSWSLPPSCVSCWNSIQKAQ